MNINLQQKQEVKLRMTAMLSQSIQLLQYTSLELLEFLTEEQVENPLLEVDVNFPRSHYTYISKNKRQSLYDMTKDVESVSDYRYELYKLAKIQCSDIRTLFVLKYVIFNLDDNGYFEFDVEDLIVEAISEEEITAAINVLQTFAPTGTGAKNLQECLVLQAQKERNNTERVLLVKLIQECLHLVASQKWKEIAAHLRTSIVNVKQLYEKVKLYNPRPCAALSCFGPEFIEPDVVIELVDGQLHYKLHDYYFPVITMNPQYVQALQEKGETANFIAHYYKRFDWLKKSLEQRRITMEKVMNVLLERQRTYFEKGDFYMKPLLLKELAEEIGLHESTISRATKNKIIQTSWGLVPMRRLFTTGFSTGSGEIIAQSKVKKLVQQLIENENKQSPLSDQKIANFLQNNYSLQISRRTVNKYREELCIPNASERKRK